MATYIEQSLSKLEQFEGAIPWMYRDTVGRVTAGVGMMLTDAARAQSLPFQVDGQPASPETVAAEFQRVNALPMGRPAAFYHREGGPELSPDAMTGLLRGVVESLDQQLRAAISNYDSLPDGAKLALLDMAYNLGPGGLLHGYPKLLKAIQGGQWQQAAANCFRHGPGAARNQWTQQMFSSCVLNAVQAVAEEAEGVLLRFAYGVVGCAATAWERFRRR